MREEVRALRVGEASQDWISVVGQKYFVRPGLLYTPAVTGPLPNSPRRHGCPRDPMGTQILPPAPFHRDGVCVWSNPDSSVVLTHPLRRLHPSFSVCACTRMSVCAAAVMARPAVAVQQTRCYTGEPSYPPLDTIKSTCGPDRRWLLVQSTAVAPGEILPPPGP